MMIVILKNVEGGKIVPIVPNDRVLMRRSKNLMDWYHPRAMQKITPFLWFDTQAEQAAEFYVSLFSGSSIDSVNRGPDGAAFVVNFTLDGKQYTALNGGDTYKLNPAYSQMIHCDDQAEVDHYWAALTEEGEEGRCGWLVDKFGLSWQVVPKAFGELMSQANGEQAGRLMAVMFASNKFDIKALEEAFRG